MRVIFMGTPEFAVPCLKRLVEDGHEVAGVFTQPDRPQGRGYRLMPPPVKELALSLGLPVFQPTKMRDGTVAAQFRELRPDLAVVVAYGRILPPDLLALPRFGCVNVHGSLLPAYRGAAPIQWSVLNGDPVGGVTTMFMAEGLDTGDIILQESTPIGEDETSGELYERLSQIGADCLSRTLRLFEGGEVPRTPQGERFSYAPMLDKEMARIDFDKTASEIHNLVRGMSPWPVAYTRFQDKLLKVHRLRPAPEFHGAPGTLLDRKRFIVGCKDGAVELLQVQLEGAKRMEGGAFICGRPIKVGTLLTLPSSISDTLKE